MQVIKYSYRLKYQVIMRVFFSNLERYQQLVDNFNYLIVIRSDILFFSVL